jgi:tetratricopeptide (TPR) repeat protein
MTSALWWLWIWGWLMTTLPIPAGNYFQQGNSRYLRGEHEQAERLYALCFNTPWLAQEAFYNAGNAAYQRGAFSAAVGYFEQALERDPEDEDAWFNLELARRHLDQNQAGPKEDTPPPQTGPPRLSQPNPPRVTRLHPDQPLNEDDADRILAQARQRERQVNFYRPLPARSQRSPQMTDDIFTQTPEELLQTLRDQTRAGYPFRPGSSLAKPRILPDQVDW